MFPLHIWSTLLDELNTKKEFLSDVTVKSLLADVIGMPIKTAKTITPAFHLRDRSVNIAYFALTTADPELVAQILRVQRSDKLADFGSLKSLETYDDGGGYYWQLIFVMWAN